MTRRALTDQAYDELTKQCSEAKHPMANSLASLIGLYLRPDLYARKDWKETFESYVTFELQPDDSLCALLRPIAAQPYYSPTDRGHLPTIHD